MLQQARRSLLELTWSKDKHLTRHRPRQGAMHHGGVHAAALAHGWQCKGQAVCMSIPGARTSIWPGTGPGRAPCMMGVSMPLLMRMGGIGGGIGPLISPLAPSGKPPKAPCTVCLSSLLTQEDVTQVQSACSHGSCCTGAASKVLATDCLSGLSMQLWR